MRFFWGGHFEFSESAILNFFLPHLCEKSSPFIWGIIFFCTMNGLFRILEKRLSELICTRLYVFNFKFITCFRVIFNTFFYFKCIAWFHDIFICNIFFNFKFPNWFWNCGCSLSGNPIKTDVITVLNHFVMI